MVSRWRVVRCYGFDSQLLCLSSLVKICARSVIRSVGIWWWPLSLADGQAVPVLVLAHRSTSSDIARNPPLIACAPVCKFLLTTGECPLEHFHSNPGIVCRSLEYWTRGSAMQRHRAQRDSNNDISLFLSMVRYRSDKSRIQGCYFRLSYRGTKLTN